MYLQRPTRFLAAGALVLLAGITPIAAEGRATAAADRAFVAGEHARALELYDAVLAEQPDNLHALTRSARLLSWDGRLHEAIARYEAALTLDPEHRSAALGRAVVLSWDGHLDRAIEELERLHSRRSGDREVRIALARTLAWKGEYTEARKHYDDLLAADPGDLEALLGLARIHAWSGDLARARDGYERVLALDPDNKDARVGQGYVALWSDDLDGAERRLAALETRFPDDREVRRLRTDVERAAAPSLRVQAERTDDTDDHRLDVYRVSAGWRVARGTRLDAGLARYEMRDPAATASIHNLNVAVHTRPGHASKLGLHLGLDRRRRSDGTTDDALLGGASFRSDLDRRWQFGARVARDAVRYSPLITDNGITLDEAELSVTGSAGLRWRIDLHAGAASVSDGNDRRHFVGTGSYRWPLSTLVLETGYLFRYLDYREDLPSGYFDPADFFAHLARVRGRGKFGSNGNTYSFGVDAGVQSFTVGGVDVSNDTVLVLSGTLAFPLGRGVTLELFGYRGDYAAQTAAGFESRQLGLRLGWQPGAGR